MLRRSLPRCCAAAAAHSGESLSHHHQYQRTPPQPISWSAHAAKAGISSAAVAKLSSAAAAANNTNKRDSQTATTALPPAAIEQLLRRTKAAHDELIALAPTINAKIFKQSKKGGAPLSASEIIAATAFSARGTHARGCPTEAHDLPLLRLATSTSDASAASSLPTVAGGVCEECLRKRAHALASEHLALSFLWSSLTFTPTTTTTSAAAQGGKLLEEELSAPGGGFGSVAKTVEVMEEFAVSGRGGSSAYTWLVWNPKSNNKKTCAAESSSNNINKAETAATTTPTTPAAGGKSEPDAENSANDTKAKQEKEEKPATATADAATPSQSAIGAAKQQVDAATSSGSVVDGDADGGGGRVEVINMPGDSSPLAVGLWPLCCVPMHDSLLLGVSPPQTLTQKQATSAATTPPAWSRAARNPAVAAAAARANMSSGDGGDGGSLLGDTLMSFSLQERRRALAKLCVQHLDWAFIDAQLAAAHRYFGQSRTQTKTTPGGGRGVVQKQRRQSLSEAACRLAAKRFVNSDDFSAKMETKEKEQQRREAESKEKQTQAGADAAAAATAAIDATASVATSAATTSAQTDAAAVAVQSQVNDQPTEETPTEEDTSPAVASPCTVKAFQESVLRTWDDAVRNPVEHLTDADSYSEEFRGTEVPMESDSDVNVLTYYYLRNDGVKEWRYDDNTTLLVYPDGTEVHFSVGCVTTRRPDGWVLHRYADNSWRAFDEQSREVLRE